jgi:hypothetical protein
LLNSSISQYQEKELENMKKALPRKGAGGPEEQASALDAAIKYALGSF